MTYRTNILKKWIIPVITAILITGCTMGKDYVKPKPDTPAEYTEMEGWKKAEPGGKPANEKWWTVFNDSKLNELEEKTTTSNLNIVIAEAQYRKAKAAVEAAKAGYFPGVNAGVTASRSRKSENITNSTGRVTNDFALPVQASWELDLWGKVRRAVEAGKADEQAVMADLAGVRLSVQAELALDYFQVRTLDLQRKNLEETLKLYEKSYDMTQNRYKGGVVAKADVLQAETQLKSVKAQLIDLDVQRTQLVHAIAFLTGQSSSGFSLPYAPMDMTLPSIPIGVPSELLERRPDIASAERHVASANAQIGVIKAASYPTLMLSASGGFESSAIGSLLDWPSRFWSIGPSFGGTLFDGGLKVAQKKQAIAVYDATVAGYRETVLNGFREVEDNMAALKILEKEAMVQDETVKAARKALDIAANQYIAGTASYTAVILAQATALSNEKTAVAITGRRMASSVLLVKALGGGWNSDALTEKKNGKKE